MIWQKLAMVRNGLIVIEENLPHPFVPDIHKLRHITFKGFKGFLGIILVVTLRVYVKSLNFFKNIYRKLKIAILNFSQSNRNNDSLLKQETNKFLRVIAEYKHKISRMKHSIIEEEKKL
ncbi:MAG: hypothetical protein KA515_01640 [Candidatus Pacebacteria bacterium]|nr:hypothetical protein [Candidatus Paceibacterota bacterium]